MSNKFRIAVLMCLILASSSTAAFSRSLEDEKQAVRSYLKVLDSKIVTYRAQGNLAKVRSLQSEKRETLARWDSLQDSIAAGGNDDVYIPPSSNTTKQSMNVDPEISGSSIEDVREDMNKAIAELKGQLDSVKKANGDAKVGGLIRFDWTKGLNNNTSAPYNKFDISRAYLDFKKKLGAGASARVTLDVARISGAASQNLFDYLKYAYVDLPVDVPASMQVIPFSLTAKMGLQHTCWIDWSGKMWRFQNVLKAFSDANKNSVSSSADFGLGATGKFTLPAMPEIEYHATVLNGQGYAKAEADSAKDIAIRLNSDVAKTAAGTVVLGGYVGVKNGLFSTASTAQSTQSGFLLGLKNSDYGNIYLEYQNDQKSNKPVNGYSIGGFIYPAKAVVPGGFMARYDMYDADTNTANNEVKTTVIGAFYDWGKDVTMSLDVTSSQTGTAAEKKVAALRSEIKF
jgi:hypothetical protein